MYPRNAASPERIAIGAVVQISDGAVQTSGVSVKVLPIGTTASAGGGTVAYEEGIVHYLPTQAETNYTSFIVIAYKASCIPVSQTVVTTASATPGTVLLAPVTHTSAVVPTVSTLTGHTAQTGDAYARLGAPAGASVSADVAAVKGETATILADTNELQTDWVNGGRLDVILDARASQTSVDDLPTNAELATALGAADDAVLTAIGDLPTNAELATALAAADDAVLTAIGDLPTNAELATALAAADDAVLEAIDALPTATENADALLNRDMSAVSDTNSRSPLNALRFLRNKWSIAGTDLTVTKENDSTAAWTATVTAAPGAEPISGSDPA
jgi:hypothetical protein